MKKNSPQLHIEEELQEKKIDIEQLDGEDRGLGHWTVNPQFFTFPFFYLPCCSPTPINNKSFSLFQSSGGPSTTTSSLVYIPSEHMEAVWVVRRGRCVGRRGLSRWRGRRRAAPPEKDTVQEWRCVIGRRRRTRKKEVREHVILVPVILVLVTGLPRVGPHGCQLCI